jgi:hypothetical protein
MKQEIYTEYSGKTSRKWPIAKPIRTWKDNIKTGLRD